VSSVAASADGKRIASGGMDQTVKIWDATSGQNLFTLKGHAGEVKGLAFSTDGKHIISGSYDGTVKVWDATSGEGLLTLAGHTGEVLSVVWPLAATASASPQEVRI
jgi:WD40 repeat protein